VNPARAAVVAAVGAAALALTAAGPALAHGVVGRRDLPIPQWLFGWAAAFVLVVSFVALAALWPRPRLQNPSLRRVCRVPAAVDVLFGAAGVLLFALVVYSGLAGTQAPAANLAPTVVYVLMWVAVPLASVLFGDVFNLLSPWRALGRAGAWAAGRVAPGRLPEPLPYPGRLGHWPAAATLLAFTWLELVFPGGDRPFTLAVLALAYAAVQLVGMTFYGVDAWVNRADGFGVYFGLLARMSPWERREGVLHLRPPLSGLPGMPVLAGTVALLCVAIGTTTFDGLSQGPVWKAVTQALQPPLVELGLGFEPAAQIVGTLGLVGCVLLVAGLYRLGVAGMHTVGEGHSTSQLSRSFAHSLVPIAFAYLLAHYFSLLAYQGQATAFLISDPLGRGSDLFGTAAVEVDYDVIRATGLWYVQVGALICGHVAGLVLAHDRAVAVYDRAREATRSQYWMLLVMVAFTSLGLWLLSAVGG
jgi:hypothetical protein